MRDSAAFFCENLYKTYMHSAGDVSVLRGASMQAQQGELVALVGPSGSGKSSFLHVMGLLDEADSGSVGLLGKDATSLNEREKTQFRREHIGFVFQKHHLLPELSVIENVMMPLRLQHNLSLTQVREKSALILEQMGISHRLNHQPSELSGGEAQRVAIARAMVHQPKLVLADEPTGNLDGENTQQVMQHFMERCRSVGASAIVVTHNMQVARMLDRVVTIDSGKVQTGAV